MRDGGNAACIGVVSAGRVRPCSQSELYGDIEVERGRDEIVTQLGACDIGPDPQRQHQIGVLEILENDVLIGEGVADLGKKRLALEVDGRGLNCHGGDKTQQSRTEGAATSVDATKHQPARVSELPDIPETS